MYICGKNVKAMIDLISIFSRINHFVKKNESHSYSHPVHDGVGQPNLVISI